MKNIKDIWSKKHTYEKVLLIIGGICSISVITLGIMQIFGIWEKAIAVAEPLLGLMILTQAILYWKKSKAVAIFSLLVAVLIFIISIYIFFLVEQFKLVGK